MPDIKKLRERVRLATARRDAHATEWRFNYRAMFGRLWEDRFGKRDINSEISTIHDFMTGHASQHSGHAREFRDYSQSLLLAFFKTILPDLAFNIPHVDLRARPTAENKKPEATATARLTAGALNAMLADMDGLPIELQMILADTLCALGIAKVLHRANILDIPVDEGMLKKAVKALKGKPKQKLGEPTFSIERVSPFSFIIDEEAEGHMERAALVGEEMNKSIEAMRATGFYKKEIIDALKEHLIRKGNKDKEEWEIKATYFEMYMLQGEYAGELLVFADTDFDEFLRKGPVPNGIDRHPYVDEMFLKIPGQYYTVPEASVGRVPQNIYNQVGAWERDHARKSHPQVGVKSNVDDAEKRKLMDGKSNYIELNSEGDVFPVNSNLPKSVSWEELRRQVSKDFNEAMGQSEADRGASGNPEFAAEVETIAFKGEKRDSYRLAVSKRFISRIIEKLLIQIKANWPTEVKKGVSFMDANKEEWAIFTKSDLNPDVDIEISIENKSAKTVAIERKQMIDAATANPIWFESQSFQTAFFDTFPEIRDKDRIILEIQQLQAQKAAAEAEAAKNQPEPVVPKMTLSLSPGPETPTQFVDAAWQAYFASLGMNVEQGASEAVSGAIEPGNGGTVPNTGESVKAGTEGMGRGAGEFPKSGEIV